MFNMMLFLIYLAILSVLLIIVAPTPVHSVLFGLLFYVVFGFIFILSGYDFIGVTFIVIYAGALMVMFLFVIMAFDLTRSVSVARVTDGNGVERWSKALVILLSCGISLRLVRYLYVTAFVGMANYAPYPIGSAEFYDACLTVSEISCCGAPLLEEVGYVFYQGHLVSIILCGLLLLVGLIGAVALTEVCRPLRSHKRVRSPLRLLLHVERRVVNLRRKE